MKKRQCIGLMASLWLLGGMVSAQVAPSANSSVSLRKVVTVPSRPLMFLTSETGKKIAAGFPPLAGYLAGMGINVQPGDSAATRLLPDAVPSVISQDKIFQANAFPDNAPCNAPAGALFNLEPETGSPEIHFPVPQFANAVDHIQDGGAMGADLVIGAGDDYRGVFDQIRNGGGASPQQFPNAWGFTMSGYYVHRTGSDCSASFEGALPHIPYRPTGDELYGYSPTVALDPTRNRAYAVDVRFAATVNGLGLFATTVSSLNDAAHCANGTHLTDSTGLDTAASMCWPTAAVLNPQRNIFPSTFSDKPHLAVDTRADGVGAGDVYVSWTNFDLFHGIAYIQLIEIGSLS